LSRGGDETSLPSPDGQTIYALRGTMPRRRGSSRFAASAMKQTPVSCPAASDDAAWADAAVSTARGATAPTAPAIGSWLVLPPGHNRPSKPAAVWSSPGRPDRGRGAAGHWRWNPHLLVERGYAVHCRTRPSRSATPAHGRARLGEVGARHPTRISYGPRRGTDPVPDLDASRLPWRGGSYGGYMANWPGTTDRFRAIVTHASLWDLRPFHARPTRVRLGARDGRPNIASPSCTIAIAGGPRRLDQDAHARHPGERTSRAGVGALALWTEPAPPRRPGRFLYFSRTSTTGISARTSPPLVRDDLAFLDEHVSQEWVRPALL